MRQDIGKWLPEIWQETGGVVSQRDAACIIGISDQSVKEAGEKGRIKVYHLDNLKRYSFHDCIKFKKAREKALNFVKEEAYAEKLKSENPEAFIKYNEEKGKKSFEEYEASLKEEHLQELKDEYENSPEGIAEKEAHESHEQYMQEELETHLAKEFNKLRIKLIEEFRSKYKK